MSEDVFDRALDRRDAVIKEQRRRIKALEGLLREGTDALEAEIQGRSANDLPRRIERDMEPVKKARALLKEADQ